MTASTIKDLGFTERAAQLAGSDHAAVDEKQRKSSGETNLHTNGGQPPQIPGLGGMLTITFGAAPGSVPVKNPFPDNWGAVENPYSSMLSSGGEDLSRAEDATENFISNNQRDVEAKPADGPLPAGTELWKLFLRFCPN